MNGNVVTITGEGALYYNYNGIDVPARSAAVEGDIVVPENTKIYAFAVASGKLQSELVSARVYVSPTQQDTLSHFNAGETDWFTNAVIYNYAGEAQPTPESNWAAKAAYYFGKNGWAGNMVDHAVRATRSSRLILRPITWPMSMMPLTMVPRMPIRILLAMLPMEV